MRSLGKRVDSFDVVLNIFFIFVCMLMIYPFWFVIIGSLMEYSEYAKSTFIFWPKSFNIDGYKFIWEQGQIFAPFWNTVLITLVGTLVSLAFTAVAAYGLARRFPGSKALYFLIILTMFIDAGLIPLYVLYKNMGMINKMPVFIIPRLCNAFFLVVMRTHFLSFSSEIVESAEMDGCGHLRIFVQIVLPLSQAILATIALFYAVDYWNTFFTSVFFVYDAEKRTLQDYLYRIISNLSSDMSNNSAGGSSSNFVNNTAIQMGSVVIAVLPILVVYPFLQSYFVKGVMIGSVKG
ncbi:MAG: carbohydrate ABC transporter permease [Spirochaetales bacterium]|nr:carbohydrate ABC transporter permease [Spirochaetales bacterium]